MYGDNDTSETENHITLDQTSSGQNAQKWGCVQVSFHAVQRAMSAERHVIFKLA